MPKDYSKFALVRLNELWAAIQSVVESDFERGWLLRLRFEQNRLTISSGSTVFIGEYEETIGTLYTEQAVESVFDIDYILDFIKALGDEEYIRFEFKDAKSALEMRPEVRDAGYSWRYFCMPHRAPAAYLTLPADFTTSVSRREFQPLIMDTDFNELNERGSSLIFLNPDSLTLVIRDGYRLSLRKAMRNASVHNRAEHRILVPHRVMHKMQLLLYRVWRGERRIRRER